MSGRIAYVAGFTALGVLGTVAVIGAAAGLAMLMVAAHAEVELAGIDEWIAERWLDEDGAA